MIHKYRVIYEYEEDTPADNQGSSISVNINLDVYIQHSTKTVHKSQGEWPTLTKDYSVSSTWSIIRLNTL